MASSPGGPPERTASAWNPPAAFLRLPAWDRPTWMWIGMPSSSAASQKGSSSADNVGFPDG